MYKNSSPIVVLGGFLSHAAIYSRLSQRLAALTGAQIIVVDANMLDWTQCVTKHGWLLVLNKLDAAVKKALGKTTGKKLTLIGHSQGGILGRFYLSSRPLLGKRFCGSEYIDRLITLGSPHYNQGGLRRGGQMARWVQSHVTDSSLTPDVRFTSVVGRYVRGDLSGSLSERLAFRTYKDICGTGDVWGDGIAPVSSALLSASEQITLVGVSHYAIVGQPWYGSEGVIEKWWHD